MTLLTCITDACSLTVRFSDRLQGGLLAKPRCDRPPFVSGFPHLGTKFRVFAGMEGLNVLGRTSPWNPC